MNRTESGRNRIRYIGYFDFQDAAFPRNYTVAASNKMEYIVDALNRSGYDVELVSVSASTEPRFRLHKGSVVRRTPHFRVRFLPTFGGGNKLLRVVRTLWHTAALFFYLVLKVRCGETILVYHSLGYFNALLLAKRLKRFRLVLETEEIYQDVSPMSDRIRRWEYAMFAAADGYIFSTELLDRKLNAARKPHAIVYGDYRVGDRSEKPDDDGKIHVVYAGTFDRNKGGALAAVAAAAYLPSAYHLHIIGFGTEEDTASVRKAVADTHRLAKAGVTFEGLKKGREYTDFLQRCHIGLSTQNPSAAFNATSFPSKILSYMACGLRVVSIRIDAVTESAIGKEIIYYNRQTPREIAAAIASVDLSAKNEGRSIIRHLDEKFRSDLIGLLTALQ